MTFRVRFGIRARRSSRTLTATLAALAAMAAMASPAFASITFTSFSPTTGPIGTSVTIDGTGFTTCTGVTIAFNGTNAGCVFVSSTALRSTVPAHASTGQLTVNGAPASTGTQTFTVTLGITSTPAFGPPTTNVTVSGTAFAQYEAIDLYFDVTPLQLVFADSAGNFTAITVPVPASAQPGTHYISALGRKSQTGAQKTFRVATSWTDFGYGGKNAGLNPFENTIGVSNVGELDQEWAAPAGTFPDRSQPALAAGLGANGILYVGSQSAKLFAIDAKTGAALWNSGTNIGGNIETSPAYSATTNKVYLGADDGKLYAFPTTCSTPCAPSWVSAAGAADVRGSPVVSGGFVYVGSTANGVEAFSTACASGCAPTWTSGTSGVATRGSPAVAGGNVYESLTSGTVRVFPEGCASNPCPFTWESSGLFADVAVSPAISNGIVVAAGNTTSANGVAAFAAHGCGSSTCAPLWSYGDSAPTQSHGGPAIAHGVVFVSLDGNLFALNLRTGVQIWHGAVGGSLDENTPTVANGVVYVASNDGNLYAFSATGCGGSSGALCPSLWSQKVTSTGTAAPPVIANGFVYVSSGDGVVYAFDTKPSTAPVKRPRLSELRRARTG